MKYRLLDILVCPFCGNSMEFVVFQQQYNDTTVDPLYVRCQNYCYLHDISLEMESQIIGINQCRECYKTEIVDGLLLCNVCSKLFPIINTIPRILPGTIYDHPEFFLRYKEKLLKMMPENLGATLPKMIEKTKKTFAYEWLNERLGFTSKAETLIGFFAKTGIDPNLNKIDFSGYESDRPAEEIQYNPDGSFLGGKLILDIGCGMGRYMNIVNMYGGEVIGFDLSAAVEKARKDTEHNPFTHVVQADIMLPPFKKKSFDFIYSIGVLHHTPDTKKSFKCVTPLLKNNGTFSLCVYEKSKYPIKNFMERTVRKITTKLPLNILFYLSYIGVPLGWLQKQLRKNRIIFILTAPLFLFQMCEHWDMRIRHTDTFDFYVAPYQWRHTDKEVIKWFEEEGFVDIQILPDNPICVTGIKKCK